MVELMVGAALGLLLMAGAIGIFVSSKQVYRTEDALSRNQENGRFAMDFLVRKTRQAGFTGCGNLEDIEVNVIANDPPTDGFSLNSTLVGYDGDGTNGAGGAWINPTTIVRVAGSDILTIGSGGDCAADLTGNLDVDTAQLQITGGSACKFKQNDALLITDCQMADLFRASSVSAATDKINIAHAENVNSANFLSKLYQKGATVLAFNHTTYFIGTADGSLNPSLYRLELGGTAEPLVENIQDMQLEYGVDNENDGLVDSYQSASAVTDWTRVLGVRVNLLVRSDDNITLEPRTVAFNGTDVNAGLGADRRLRTIFNTTVAVRNRVP
ncbi:MAG: PilW family protein [Pseudomonadota bacterium]